MKCYKYTFDHIWAIKIHHHPSSQISNMAMSLISWTCLFLGLDLNLREALDSTDNYWYWLIDSVCFETTCLAEATRLPWIGNDDDLLKLWKWFKIRFSMETKPLKSFKKVEIMSKLSNHFKSSFTFRRKSSFKTSTLHDFMSCLDQVAFWHFLLWECTQLHWLHWALMEATSTS